MADASRHTMFYVAESTYGTTPNDPTLQSLRNTGTTLALTKESFQSEERRSDRQIDDFRHGLKQVGGEHNFELSYTSFDDFLEACLGGQWVAKAAPYSASTISAVASDNSINDSADGFPSLAAGDVIAIAGFTGETDNNGEVTVVSATTSKIVVSGITLVDDAAGGSVTVTQLNDVLKAGTERRSFSVVRHFEDIETAANPYHIFRGVEINTLSLSVPAQGYITGSFGVIGKSMVTRQDLTDLGTPVLSNANGNQGMDSFSGSLKEGGAINELITAIDLSLDNGIAVRNVVGSDETIRPSIDRSNLTGSIDAFFEDSTLLDKFLNETESALNFTLQDPAGNRYIFILPRIKYSGGQPDVSSGPIPLNMPFQALRDATENTNIKVLRIPAA